MFFLMSCLESYLDKAPESGLPEEEVFKKFDNAYKFLDYCFIPTVAGENSGVFATSQLGLCAKGPINYDIITDWCDDGRVSWWEYHKRGPLGDNNVHFGPYLPAFFQKIRIANIFLQNVKNVEDGIKEEIDDLIGRAYFVRGWCHFELFRLWGPMPYLTKPLGGDDQWDIPRLPKQECLKNIAADMDTAALYFEKAGKMRRDPLPGQAGHLNAPDQKYPNGCTAKAIKARALLYAASPLNNESNDIELWKAATIANWEALTLAEQYGYDLLSPEKYSDNYYGVMYSNEMLWGHHYGVYNFSGSAASLLLSGVVNNAYCGTCPTQGTVDLYETKWGDPLNTQEDRDAAAAQGHYNEQDPFVNREPRFYITIIYNGAPLEGYGTAKIYFEMKDGEAAYSELAARNYARKTETGYYSRKIWGGASPKNPINIRYTTPMIRLGELYLNYAEAANEAYGPKMIPPGATMTAVDAINFIRNGGINTAGRSISRWTSDQIAPVQDRLTNDREVFRIWNERKVELSFEAQYYFDIRRWKHAPVTMAGPLMGNMPEKLKEGEYDPAIYPTGFKFTRLPLSDDRQCYWIDAKYYLPFTSADYNKIKNFDPGQRW